MPYTSTNLEKKNSSIFSKNKFLTILVGVFLFLAILTGILIVLYIRGTQKLASETKNQTAQTVASVSGGFQQIQVREEGIQLGQTTESNVVSNQGSMVVKSTGVVKEVVLSNGTLPYSPFKIDILRATFDNGSGKQIPLDIAVQIIPESTGSNIFPWFIEGAYADRFNGASPQGETLNLSDLKTIFSEGSSWVFVPLLKSNLSEGLQTQDAYTKYLNSYYTDEEWNYLEEAYKNKFNNFTFSKLIFISKLFSI